MRIYAIDAIYMKKLYIKKKKEKKDAIYEHLENKNIKTIFSHSKVDMGLLLGSYSCEH